MVCLAHSKGDFAADPILDQDVVGIGLKMITKPKPMSWKQIEMVIEQNPEVLDSLPPLHREIAEGVFKELSKKAGRGRFKNKPLPSPH